MIETNFNPKASDLLPEVIAAVTEAGAMIRAEFHHAGGPRGRGGHAPVDIEAEALLRQRLLELHRCSWRGEETRAATEAGDDAWLVDPNDGTSDFLAGRRGSAVSVALLRRGKPVLGVVYAPLAPDDHGDLIAWAEGVDLTRNGVRVVRPELVDRPVVALNANAADYALHNHTMLPGLRVRALPSPAYRLALTAVGEVDAAISLVGGLAHWDIAGGHALLIGAGCVVVDGAGREIDYRKTAFDGVIAGHKEVVERIVGLRLVSGRRDPRRPARPSRPEPDARVLSPAQGTLLGQLAGDALGSAVEFRTATDIAGRHPDGVKILRDGGTWDLIAGQPTDDSEMALALARSLVARGGFDAQAVGAAYVAWRDSRPFDIGGTTANGISALAQSRQARSDSQSNGALMRVSPIGIFVAGEQATAARLAAEDARLTHPHPVCQAASAAYAAAIAAGIQCGEAETMWQAAFDYAGEGAAADAVRERLELARSCAPTDFQHPMGWALTAFQNAFYWLMRSGNVDEAVIATVAAGGDTDTNAAICGALLGALLGRDAVPLQWRNAVLTCRPVQAEGVHHPRPKVYWPDDALELAEALLAASDSREPSKQINEFGCR